MGELFLHYSSLANTSFSPECSSKFKFSQTLLISLIWLISSNPVNRKLPSTLGLWKVKSKQFSGTGSADFLFGVNIADMFFSLVTNGLRPNSNMMDFLLNLRSFSGDFPLLLVLEKGYRYTLVSRSMRMTIFSSNSLSFWILRCFAD